MNQQTVLKYLEYADRIIDEVCNTGYTLQDCDVRVLKDVFGIIKNEVEDESPSKEFNIVHCPDCKYCVKTKDGEYNPDDIVCSYWASDGLESGDFCSYGEKGEYEWYDQEDHQVYGIWRSAGPLVDSMECSECGYQVCVKDLYTPFCPWCGVKMVNFKKLEEKRNES